MSGESTPMLGRAVQTLDKAIGHWDEMIQKVPHCVPLINIGLACAGKYHSRMTQTMAYAVAMCQSHVF
jgi:hypothetical protein